MCFFNLKAYTFIKFGPCTHETYWSSWIFRFNGNKSASIGIWTLSCGLWNKLKRASILLLLKNLNIFSVSMFDESAYGFQKPRAFYFVGTSRYVLKLLNYSRVLLLIRLQTCLTRKICRTAELKTWMWLPFTLICLPSSGVFLYVGVQLLLAGNYLNFTVYW